MTPGWVSWVQAFLGTAVGALVTWAVSRHYYARAASELEAEAAKLRKAQRLLLLGMQQAGWVELTFDADGEIVGFKQVISPGGIPSAEAVGRPTLIQHLPPKET